MADSILKLKVESSEYDAKLKKAAEGIQHLAEVAHRSGGELTGLEKAELDYIKSLGDMSTKSRTAAGSVRELENTFKELTVVYNQLNDVEKQDEGGKALAASLDKLKQRAQEARAELDNASKALGNQSEEGKKTSGMLDGLAGKFGLNVGKLMKFGGATGAATAALKVAKDAFFNNEEQLDEWGRTVESAESLYKGFLNSLNTGDIIGFLSNIDQITQAARDAYNALDELATFNAFNKANIAGARAELSGAIADYREGKGNKDNVSKASEELIKELETKQKLQREAYEKVIANVAAERQVDSDALLKVMTGKWGSFKELKDLRFTGIKETPHVGFGGRTYYTQEAVPANERERLAQAVKHLNDTEIDNFQSLAEAAKMTQVEINNQRKMVARVLNGRQGGAGSGSGGGGGRSGGGGNTEVEAAIGSIDYQTKKVQELQKAWRAAADDDSRRKIKAELESAQVVLNNMTENVFDTSNLKQIAPTAITVPKMELTDPMSGLTAMKQSIRLDLKTEAVKVDETTLQTMLKDAVQNGINGMDFQFNALGKKIGAGIDVPDSAWEGILEQYNALREQIGLEPITIDFKTGNIEKLSDDAKRMGNEFQSASSAISAVGSAMQMIEDPAAKVAGTVAQAIATIALTFAQSLKGTVTPWDWIAATVSGVATMYSTISAIHSATGYANGGMVKGSSYSGDNIPALVDGSQMVGLNAGEKVLNQAQTANVANALEGGGMRGVDLSAHVSGEQIVLVANRFFKRTGQGEIVTWK